MHFYPEFISPTLLPQLIFVSSHPNIVQVTFAWNFLYLWPVGGDLIKVAKKHEKKYNEKFPLFEN